MYKFIDAIDDTSMVDEAYVKSVESKYGITFPRVLRNFYLSYNGAEIVECPFSKHNIDFCVVEITPLKYGTRPVEKILDYNKNNKWIPDTYVPLALDEEYEDYYWQTDTGKVVFLSRANDENPIPISDSIEEFFELLNESVE